MPAPKPLPPIDYLRQCFKLLPDGTIIRRSTGKPALTASNHGYRHGHLDGKKLLAHRVVYALHYGIDPGNKQIDHINHDPSDNRPENLRLCTGQQNGMNQSKQKNNKSGYSNIHLHKPSGKWCVSFQVNRRRHFIGYFDDLDDAIAARDEAAVRLGFHKNHGQRAHPQKVKRK